MADIKDTNRIVFFSGQFEESKTQATIERILTLESQSPTKDIIMYIDSYGGNVHSLLAIHDVMKNLCRCDIATVCVGKAMSCGQMLLMSGTKGKRFATTNARILVHEVSSGTFGKLAEMELDIMEAKTLQKTVEKLVVTYSKLKPKEIKEIMKRDSYLSVEEAKKFGIIDHIIEKPSDLYKKIKS